MPVAPDFSSLLRPENFERGFLIDAEWMAGISRESEGFLAYVVNHQAGEVVARQQFGALDDALAALNRLPRTWKFESTSGCSGERCGEGKCKGAACRIYRAPSEGCEEKAGC